MNVVIDMNLSPEWADLLRGEGFEAVHWSEVGDPRAEDSEIVAWALDRGAVIFTHDLDFSRILALAGATRPSVLQVRGEDLLPESISVAVVDALREHAGILADGALIVIDQISRRIRLLPLID